MATARQAKSKDATRRRRDRGTLTNNVSTSQPPVSHPDDSSGGLDHLPLTVTEWFQRRGWQPRPHQLQLLRQARLGRSTLLIAPTGAGKTLAGFLPSLVEFSAGGRPTTGSGLHTVYISPLKALAVDVERNLLTPISEMGLPIRVETRTGDTPASKRQRQRTRPPQILLTTPEQLALLLSSEDAHWFFADVKRIIFDELHALAPTKRGDLLALGLARLRRIATELAATGLSATVARPAELCAWLALQPEPKRFTALADLVSITGGAQPDVTILETEDPLPWASHTARYAVPEVLAAIALHRLTLVFVNTRMQAELMFQELWRQNDAGLPIALHHGSLDVAQRRKVEAAMAAGKLRAVVATSTLDLGIDWGDVDLVLQIGAPKGASRLLQRIGRANHRLDAPSRAILVPSNRFEVLECRAALEAATDGTQDAVVTRRGAVDVLAQHVLGMACARPIARSELYAEVATAYPYIHVTQKLLDRVVDFVATGGYSLRAYERFAKLRPTEDHRLRVAHPRIAQQYRLNIGTIVDSPMLKVRLVGPRGIAKAGAGKPLAGGRVLGEIDEWFAGELKQGDAFVFAGEIVRLEGTRDTEVYVSRAKALDPIVPSYPGGKFPLSTHLAGRVRAMLADPSAWPRLPTAVADWLELQRRCSIVPSADEILIETFPRSDRHHMVLYPFEGRLAHQTLGMLLTRRLERLGAKPLGFVANDYAVSIWCLEDLSSLIACRCVVLPRLLEEDMLGDDLEAWLAETSLMRRAFRHCAVIAGMIERRHPGKEKSGRQLTISSDLIYDVLRRHEPGHILLEAAYDDAATGLLDIGRLQAFLRRIQDRIRHIPLSHASPLSVPVLLEMGRETVRGEAQEFILREAADNLIRLAIAEE